MKAIVIGAGIVGASVSYRLAEAGAEVLTLEAGRVGGGTSGVSYAWVNACEKIARRDYFELNFAGWKAHAALVEELGEAPWLHRPGVVQWADAGAEAAGLDDGEPVDKLGTLQKWGYPAEALSLEELRRLEPEVAVDSVGNSPIIHYPRDGWCDAPVYAGALLSAARTRHGAALETGVRVTRVLTRAGRAIGVETADGAVRHADIVVNCAGRWSDVVPGDPSLAVPLKPTLGVIAYTPATPTTLRRALRTPLVNLRLDGGGRLLLRSNDLDKVATARGDLSGEGPASTDYPVAQELLRRAIMVLPSLAGTPVEAVRTATRPIPRDGFPAVGPVPGLDGYYIVVSHSGVTLGPFFGIAAADEIVRGRKRDELANFRPAQFFQ